MKRQSVIKKMLLLAAVCSFLSSCTASKEAESPKEPAVTQVPVALAEYVSPTEAPALALINGRSISLEDASHVLASLQDFTAMTGESFSETQLREMAFSALTEQTLMDLHAEEWGIALSDEEVRQQTEQAQAEWDQMIDYYAGLYYQTSEQSSDEDIVSARQGVADLLAASGFDQKSFIRDALAVAQNERVEAKMAEGIRTVTEEDIQKHYEAMAAQDEAQYADDIYTYEMNTTIYGEESLYVPAGYRYASWILLDVDDALLTDYIGQSALIEENSETSSAVDTAAREAAAQAMLDSVQGKCDEIRARFDEGVPFSDLIAQYGIDKNTMDGDHAVMGQPVHAQSIMWDPAIIRALFAIDQPGEISSPVVGNAGVYLVCYLGDVPSGAREMTDELHDRLMEEVQAELKSDACTAMMDSWISSAEIVYTDLGTAWLKGNE